MKHQLIEINPLSVAGNVFKLIGEDWMLITAGTAGHFNMMTASWGGWGVLWNRKVCFCVLRPQRYTRCFVEESSTFSLSFFSEEYRQALEFCGSRSGRQVNKAVSCGLTPLELNQGILGFAESRLILGCRKLYFQDLDPNHFLDATIEKLYPNGDYHRMYIGEVIGCWQQNRSEFTEG
jgi:flavin reductase (DIM6/NTAB) family NADH-FMN oxidoreductase RutF